MTVVPGGEIEFRPLPGRTTGDPLEGIPSESSVRVVRLRRTPGRTAHRHPHSEEVFYVVAGSGTLWLEGERHPVAPGSVVRIPPGSAHATIPGRDEDMLLVCFFPHPALQENTEETGIEVDDGEETR